MKIDHRLATQPIMSIYRVDLAAFSPHSRKDTPKLSVSGKRSQCQTLTPLCQKFHKQSPNSQMGENMEVSSLGCTSTAGKPHWDGGWGYPMVPETSKYRTKPSSLKTSITMVCGTYNYSEWGVKTILQLRGAALYFHQKGKCFQDGIDCSYMQLA